MEQRMMKKLIMTGPRTTAVTEVPIPAYDADHMPVKVTYTGMCHSEPDTRKKSSPGHGPGHERRMDYEAMLCRRCMELPDKGIWDFKGVTSLHPISDFDKVSEWMENHKNGYIKGAFYF